MAQRVYHCPVEVSMDILGGRWTCVILAQVKEAPRRYSDLQRLIPDISDKVLTDRLQSLEDDGILRRTEVPGGQRHVEYTLTEQGLSLRPVLQALYDWGSEWAVSRQLTVTPTAE